MTNLSIVASDGVPVAARIKPKERDSVVQALRAGVVPRSGVQHVQVGRVGEVKQVVLDIDRIADGGPAVRFIIGDYGSGKTFFLSLARSIAIQRKLVVVHADLSPDRRIHATGGHARSLYAELMRNMATRTKPEGGALASVVERFIGDAQAAAKAAGRKVDDLIQDRLAPIQDLVSGYDFATAIERYWRAFEEGNETGKAAALRWLRGEYTLKTEAREALGVRSIIDDATVYDYLKVMGRFVTLAGYSGFLVVLDECVNLFKLVNAQARNANYEQILRIVNDMLQGSTGSIGFYFGGTPEFLMDSRRGLYSYEALRSRLAENTFARNGLVDLSGPVIRLQNLTPEDLYILLGKLRHVFAYGDPARTWCRTTRFRLSCPTATRRSARPTSGRPATPLRRFSICWPSSSRTPALIGAPWSARSRSRRTRHRRAVTSSTTLLLAVRPVRRQHRCGRAPPPPAKPAGDDLETFRL